MLKHQQLHQHQQTGHCKDRVRFLGPSEGSLRTDGIVKDLGLNGCSALHQLGECGVVCFKRTIEGVINSLAGGLGKAGDRDPPLPSIKL